MPNIKSGLFLWNIIWGGDAITSFALLPRGRPASFVHHKLSGSNISRTVWRRITKFFTDIHTDLVYGKTGYNVTSYFRSVFIKVRKTAEMPHPTAFGWISPERFKRERGSRNYTYLSGTVSHIHAPALMWPAASSRLKTAVEYYV